MKNFKKLVAAATIVGILGVVGVAGASYATGVTTPAGIVSLTQAQADTIYNSLKANQVTCDGTTSARTSRYGVTNN